MKLAIISVNYHSDSDTLSVINDLENNIVPKGNELTFYAVDNSRSAEFKKKVEEHKFCIYIDSPQGNIGFAAGNNLGLKKALEDENDLYILINNDTIIPENFVKKIIDSHITDKTVGALGGLIYFAKGFEYEDKYKKEDLGKVIWYAGGKYDWKNVYASHIGVNEVDHGQYDKVIDTDFITGCLFITKKEVLEKVGMFDERYCLYFEDSDLGLRIKKSGYKIMIDPSIKIWHKVAQSSGIGSPLNDYFLTRNRLVFGMDYAVGRTKFALIREAVKKLFIGTKAQKKAVVDFFTGNLGWGSWKN